MSQTTMSIRVDSNLKQRFDTLCDEFGLSTTAAMMLFMKTVVRECRIPFEIKVDADAEKMEIRRNAIKAFKEIRKMAENGELPDMTLDEINEEIRLAREGK